MKYLGTFLLILCLSACGKTETMYTREDVLSVANEIAQQAYIAGVQAGNVSCKQHQKGAI